jgi:uncharacterized protein (TIGR02001 family)
MKTMLMALMVMASSQVLAQTTAKVIVSNNYISRGVSFYNGGSAHAGSGTPVVQAQVDQTLGAGFSLTGFVSPVESLNLDTFALEKDTEIDWFLNYSVQAAEYLTVGASLGHYSFLKNEGNATSTVSLNAMYSFIRVDWMRTSKYSGIKTSLDYTMVSFWLPVSSKVMLTPSVGQSTWGDDSQVGHSSYADYKLGVKLTVDPQTEVDIAYTNTTGRKDWLVTQEEIKTDKAVSVSLTKIFGL